MRHTDGHPDLVRQLAYGIGESGRIQPARVGDDPHAALDGQPEPVLQLPQKGLGVAAGGVLQTVPAEDQHGQLGEIVAGQDVQGTAGEHLAQRIEAVAVEAGGIADAEGGGVGA